MSYKFSEGLMNKRKRYVHPKLPYNWYFKVVAIIPNLVTCQGLGERAEWVIIHRQHKFDHVDDWYWDVPGLGCTNQQELSVAQYMSSS